MSKEYEVEIKEVLSRIEKIEAGSLAEAIDKAMEKYYAQEIILDAEDMKDVDFRPKTTIRKKQIAEDKEYEQSSRRKRSKKYGIFN